MSTHGGSIAMTPFYGAEIPLLYFNNSDQVDKACLSLSILILSTASIAEKHFDR